MFHKTRNLEDSKWSPDSGRFTSRTTFRIGFEKCCHSPSGFCGPVGLVEYALEYFEISCVVVEIVERDMGADHHRSSRVSIRCILALVTTASRSIGNEHVGVSPETDTPLDVSDGREHVLQCLKFRKPTAP